MRLASLSKDELTTTMNRSSRRSADCAWFEDAAQDLVASLQDSFPESIVLARAYLTVPYGALPTSNMQWVEGLAKDKGVFAEMTERTPVISLVGSAGRQAAWNDRRASQGHVGIPMVSASFIDAIPMMSRLLASLGGDLAWIDAADTSFITSKLGTVAGIFHVADAATTEDARGRLVIPARDFVAEQGVKTVFGIGGAFATGQLLVLLVFASEEIPLEKINLFQTPFLHFKSAVAPLLDRVFREGRGTAPQAPAPEPTVDRAIPGRTNGEASPEALAMLLRKRTDELAQLNRAYLDLEARLDERTSALKLILDSAGDAFILVDFEGAIHGEVTATARSWFGDADPGTPACKYLFGESRPLGDAFRIGLEQIAEQIMPFELSAEVMPRRLVRDGRSYELAFAQVFERGHFVRVLVTVRDVTARLAAEEAERRARELNAMIGFILRDRRGFEDYVEESRRTIEFVCGCPDVKAILRALHTLKGNSAVCGLETFASVIHDLEGRLLESGERLDASMADELRTSWTQSLSAVQGIIELRPRNVVEITANEHEDAVKRLERGSDCRALARTLREWRHERVGIPLGRIAREAERLAARRGKELVVIVDDDNLRVATEQSAPFWSSLVHVVRNAIDHGIEVAEDRVAAGKDPRGELRLTARRAAGELVITISDDGRGLDWDAMKSRAAQATTPPPNVGDILFRDGFTTRESADDVSGRGIGLGAVRAACAAVGGWVEVESPIPNRGTVFRFHLPEGATSFA